MQPDVSDDSLKTTVQALEEEYELLHGRLPDEYRKDLCTLDHDERLRRFYRQVHALNAPVAALCLSGGGIRSATFNLGLIQALAAKGLLSQFHYLSTVSGGGYIGSWLSAWANRHPGGLSGAEAALARSCDPATGVCAPATRREPEPLRWLREYSNYLSPRLGLASADTWTLVATYFRNLVLNWLVLLPILTALLMLPRFYIWLVSRVSRWADTASGDRPLDSPAAGVWAVSIVLISLGTLLHGYTVVYRDVNRPSRRPEGATGIGNGQFKLHVLIPLLAAAVCLTVAWAALRRSSYVGGHMGATLGLMTVWSILVGTGATIAGDLVARRRGPTTSPRGWAHLARFGAILAEGFLAALFLWLIARSKLADPIDHPRLYMCLAGPVYLLAFLVAAIIARALMTPYTRDSDREWTSRGAAWVLIAVLVWAVVGVLVVFGPSYLLEYGPRARAALFGAGGAAGVLTAWLASSGATPANAEQAGRTGGGSTPRRYALSLAAPLFIVFVVVALSLAADWLVSRAPGGLERYAVLARERADEEARRTPATGATQPQRLAAEPQGADAVTVRLRPADPPAPRADLHRAVIIHTPILHLTLWFFGLLGLGVVMGHFVEINKFSLHSTYRNRLVRAYLGASRADRWKTYDPFTGFDDKDNPRMHELVSRTAGGTVRLFHVVNLALNLVRGDNLAWQQRKAQSFTVSPLHCGSGELRDEQGRRAGAYRPSDRFGGGDRGRPISLGTAMATSGAAASPNMGYHSSPAMAFLMTLFNVRLGAWFGNPRCRDTFERRAPRTSVRPLFDEALGLTNDANPYVYLSDGGHFENLGIYEMVRRRCRIIVASDASQDVRFSFQDLASAIRKAYVDMGVEIDFLAEGRIRIFRRDPKRDKAEMGQYWAVARIRYTQADGGGHDPKADLDGWLLYIKPSLYEEEPPDLLSYASECEDFPHESTADQFFSESQFESYRGLGHHIMRDTLARLKDQESPTLHSLLAALRRAAEAPPAAPKPPEGDQKAPPAPAADGVPDVPGHGPGSPAT